MVDRSIKGYQKQLSGYGSNAKELRRIETSLDGKQAMLVVLRQYISSQSSLWAHSSGHRVHHLMYILMSPQKGAGVVWVQWPNGCNVCESGTEAEILSSDADIQSFFESFKLKI